MGSIVSFCTVQSRTELSAASPPPPSPSFFYKGNGNPNRRDFCSRIVRRYNIVAIAGSHGCSFHDRAGSPTGRSDRAGER